MIPTISPMLDPPEESSGTTSTNQSEKCSVSKTATFLSASYVASNSSSWSPFMQNTFTSDALSPSFST